MHDMIFHTLVTLFAMTIVVNLLFRFLRLPIILGYLVIGMLIGPDVLDLMKPGHIIDEVAEIGLVFLMFGIGLEFSAKKLWEMREGVFLFGGGQVVISIISSLVMGYFLQVSLRQSVIIGGIIAMSSTAVVSKLLAEKKELGFQYGRDMIAILLMQDILVVPLLVLIPLLPTVVHFSELTPVMALALAKGMMLIVLMNVLGRFVLKPIFTYTVRANCDELFMLVTLFVVILAAKMSYELNLSITLGAFLAGMLLSETAYRHKIASEIRPFQDVFLGIFFVSVGMYFNFNLIATYWNWLLLMMLGLLFGKALLIILLGLVLKRDFKSSLMTGFRLAHGGEFGFALLTLTKKFNLMPETYLQVLFGGILLSLVVGVLINHLLPIFFKYYAKSSASLWELPSEDASVLICGFGRVGREVGSVLKENGVPYYAIDMNADRVDRAISENLPVYFADASLREVGYVIRDMSPALVMICFSDEETVLSTAKQIQASGYHGEIIARTYDDKQAAHLKAIGVKNVIPEIPETVYALLEKLFSELEYQESAISEILEDYKAKRAI